MVRKGELPCRNSWDTSLWQPRPNLGAGDAVSPPRPSDAIPPPPGLAPGWSLGTVAASPLGFPDGELRDVVVGQEPARGIAPPTRTAEGAQSARSAIFQARGRYRQEQAQRQSARSGFADSLPDGSAGDAAPDDGPERPWPNSAGGIGVTVDVLGPLRGSPRHLDDDARWSPHPRLVAGGGFDREVSPVPPSEVPVSDAPIVDRVDLFDSVPEIDPGFALPRAKTAPRRSLFGRGREDETTSGEVAGDADPANGPRSTIDGVWPAEPPVSRSVPQDDVVVAPERPRRVVDADEASPPLGMDRSGNDGDRSVARGAGSSGPGPAPHPSPADRVPPMRSSYDLALDRARQTRLAAGAETRAAERDAAVPTREVIEPPATDRIVAPDPPEPAIEMPPAPGVDGNSDRVDMLLTDLVSDDEVLDMTIRLAPHLPRECRTCRDFRPADSGTRGWCTNQWAFSHRRMVDAADAPCQTSLGCWWLPNDRECLAEVDVRRHGEPTPLLDAWLDQRDHAEERAEPLRRRRRS